MLNAMDIPVPPEFIDLCKDILSQNLEPADWAGVESDDMFQTPAFCGGYDADEAAFCFSYYDPDGNEYWFQLSLDSISAIASGSLRILSIRPALS